MTSSRYAIYLQYSDSNKITNILKSESNNNILFNFLRLNNPGCWFFDCERNTYSACLRKKPVSFLSVTKSNFQSFAYSSITQTNIKEKNVQLHIYLTPLGPITKFILFIYIL